MKINRVLISAPSSGAGKTTVTCGILKVLKRHGKNVVSFKCGPDFIDPLFHERVLAVPSHNLDLFLADEQTVKRVFCDAAKGCDIAVTEGAMGYYDGLSTNSDTASAYHTARVLNFPVILVINARGKALSALAEIQGFMHFRTDSRIKAVIFNQMSESVYNSIKPEVEKLGIIPLGYVPKMPDAAIESRHLGLKTPSDIADIDKRLDLLADCMEKTVDFDKLTELAQTADCMDEPPEMCFEKNYNVNIAVAKDEAFCFIYHENIALLERFGAKIKYFSPLHDEHLPENIHGLILPGGYPEVYAKELSRNVLMLNNIKESIQKGLPTLAECGGFLYLHRALEGMDGRFYQMCGVFEKRAYRTDRLQRFGYVTLSANAENPYLHESIRAHEFHYCESEESMTACCAKKPNGRTWECMITRDNLLAGFPHMYYLSDVSFVERFLERCESLWQNQ